MVAYQLLFGALGLLCGIGVAAGVFALVASLGMVPRMAGKTSVAAYVPALENGLIAGGIFGCVLAVFPELPVSGWNMVPRGCMDWPPAYFRLSVRGAGGSAQRISGAVSQNGNQNRS